MVHHRSTAPGVRHQHTQQTPQHVAASQLVLPRPLGSQQPPRSPPLVTHTPHQQCHPYHHVSPCWVQCVCCWCCTLEKRGCSRSRAGTQDCGRVWHARPRSGLRSWGGGCLRVRVGAAGHDEDMESLRLWRDSAEDKSSMVVAVSKDTLSKSHVRHGAGLISKCTQTHSS